MLIILKMFFFNSLAKVVYIETFDLQLSRKSAPSRTHDATFTPFKNIFVTMNHLITKLKIHVINHLKLKIATIVYYISLYMHMHKIVKHNCGMSH